MPHIANLRKRAKAFGYVITKTTNAQDYRDFGEHRYVMHMPDDVWEDKEDMSIYGIQSLIMGLEIK